MTLQQRTNIKRQNSGRLVAIDIDISNAIKIILPKFDLTIEESPSRVPVEFCEIESDKISLQQIENRPKGFKMYKTNDLARLRFVRFSDFIAEQHPYIKFDSNSIDYLQVPTEQPLAEYFRCFRESSRHNGYLVTLPNQDIALLDSELNVLMEYRSSQFCEGDYHLRTVELTSDLSTFCFTCVSKAYILDKNFEIAAVFQVPHKDEYEKRNKRGRTNPAIQKYLAVLGLTYPTTQEEIKAAFRKLIYKYHPDRNPDSEDAEEKTKELINAYETLSGQDISTALDSENPDEFYWVNKKHSFSTELNGMKIEVSIGPDRPDDWIYGSGFSADNSKIYLGCYSGKTYETNFDGSVSKIYIIPEDEKCDRGGPTNPLSYIYDIGEIKYILSHYYLYVLENDVVITHVKCDLGKIMWFDEGFIKQLDKEITVFDKRGNVLGNLLFKTPIKHICYHAGLLLVEFTTRTITFKVKTTP